MVLFCCCLCVSFRRRFVGKIEMAKILVPRCRDKYSGCLVGALVGDCIGSFFENDDIVDVALLKQHLDKAEQNLGENIELTDDTQMTQELADSLIAKKKFDAEDLARRFTYRYYNDPVKAACGYGANVIAVFAKLRNTDFRDPLLPALQQFNGSGSYGNGAAMRVAPVSLFAFDDLQRTATLADQTASVTHTHVLGRDGAVLQALALRKCLLPGDIQDNVTFLDELRIDLKKLQVCSKFLPKLEVVEELVERDEVSDSEVESRLGTGVAALDSVPTALYCFLRARRPIPVLSSTCPFRRTVEYAISLGGDTDTIASMAGALAGAYYGLEAINSNLVSACPDSPRAIAQANQLALCTETE